MGGPEGRVSIAVVEEEEEEEEVLAPFVAADRFDLGALRLSMARRADTC